jgi:hypothetical protein
MCTLCDAKLTTILTRGYGGSSSNIMSLNATREMNRTHLQEREDNNLESKYWSFCFACSQSYHNMQY